MKTLFCSVLMALMMLHRGISVCQAAEGPVLGLPPLPVTQNNPAYWTEMVALGTKLFQDKHLSADGKVSCATCHRPELVFSDGKPVAQGLRNQSGTRNTPSLVNVAYNTSQFWDGRRTSLEEQALDPLINPIEHGLRNPQQVLDLIQKDASYLTAFKKAFGVTENNIRIEHVTKALASFQRTLVAGNSAFDRYQYGGDSDALPASAHRGLELFKGRAGCVACHAIGDEAALFTDQEYHALGIGVERLSHKLGFLTKKVSQAPTSERERMIGQDRDIAGLGRFNVTLAATDIGKFKTPSLRNVALTAPYLHDGSIATLEEVVELELYYRRINDPRPPLLTANEKKDLVEFLKALTSDSLPQVP